MRKLLLSLVLLGACALPGSTRPPGAMGVNEGDWHVKIQENGHDTVVDCAQFDSYSGSLVPSNKESSEIAIASANNKNDRSMSLRITFPAHDKGTFAIRGHDLPTGSLTMTSSDYPAPEGTFLEAKSGSITIANYPAVGGYVTGEATALCQFTNQEGQAVKTFTVNFKFHSKRLQ